MQNEALKSKTLSGIVWKFAEKAGAQLMQVIIQIVLARLLLPEEYGLVGLLTIFIAISDVFILQGFTTALIQKQDADKVDFSSVFYANLIMSILIYVILYLCSPIVAKFYNEMQLTNIMRVLSVNVIIGALSAVHNAVLSRNLEFKKSFYRNIANIATQGIVGITLAYLDYGVWAMVLSKVAGILVGCIVLWITVRWYPQKYFSLRRLKILFSYSSKILTTNLLNSIFNNIHSLIIGRYYTTADLGYYQRGQQIPQATMTSFDGSMTEVLYPAFSKVQNDIHLLKKAVRRSIKTSMYIAVPILFGILATARTFTVIFLTDKWLPSVPFMQLSCVVCMFWPLSHRTHALNALGKSNVTLKLSLIGKSITLFSILICVSFGIYAIMIGTIISSCISLGITTYYVNKYLHYSFRELISDIFPSLLMGSIMCIVVLGIGFLNLPIILILIVQVLGGIFSYLLESIITKNDSLMFLWLTIKPYIRKNN